MFAFWFTFYTGKNEFHSTEDFFEVQENQTRQLRFSAIWGKRFFSKSVIQLSKATLIFIRFQRGARTGLILISRLLIGLVVAQAQ